MAIRILLVEDDQFKAKAILSLLTQDFSNAHVTEAKSLTSAYKLLSSVSFDIVLLDMSLPTFDVGPHDSGGEPLGFGGQKLLELLHESGINIPAVVVTQFEQFSDGDKVIDVEALERNLSNSFPENFRGLVHYNSARSDWRVSLAILVTESLGRKHADF